MAGLSSSDVSAQKWQRDVLFMREKAFISGAPPPLGFSARVHVGSTHFGFLYGYYSVSGLWSSQRWFFIWSRSPVFPCFDWLLEEGRLHQPHTSCFLLCPATIQSSPSTFSVEPRGFLSPDFALLSRNPLVKYLGGESSALIYCHCGSRVRETQTHSPSPGRTGTKLKLQGRRSATGLLLGGVHWNAS